MKWRGTIKQRVDEMLDRMMKEQDVPVNPRIAELERREIRRAGKLALLQDRCVSIESALHDAATRMERARNLLSPSGKEWAMLDTAAIRVLQPTVAAQVIQEAEISSGSSGHLPATPAPAAATQGTITGVGAQWAQPLLTPAASPFTPVTCPHCRKEFGYLHDPRLPAAAQDAQSAHVQADGEAGSAPPILTPAPAAATLRIGELVKVHDRYCFERPLLAKVVTISTRNDDIEIELLESNYYAGPVGHKTWVPRQQIFGESAAAQATETVSATSNTLSPSIPAPATAPKWCSWCKTDTHNDAECHSTRPVPPAYDHMSMPSLPYIRKPQLPEISPALTCIVPKP